MTSKQDRINELIDDETWLRDALNQQDATHFERARLLAWMAVAQEWLRGQIHDELPNGLIDRVKNRVSAEIAPAKQWSRTEIVGRPGRRQYHWAVSVLAAAAALAFAVVGLRTEPGIDEPYTASIALVEFREDGLGEMFAMLAEDIDALFEDEPASFGQGSLDELLVDVDSLVAMVEEDDWS